MIAGKSVNNQMAELKYLLACACLGLLTGCVSFPPANYVDWEPFEESQQSWPTRESGFMHRVDGFPIYALNQLPPHPYDVIGTIHVSTKVSGEKPANVEEGAVAQLALEKGGQAALTSRQTPPALQPYQRLTDYLVIRFRANQLATALERIEIFLALTANSADGYIGPGFDGGTVRYNAEELKAHRAELEKQRDAILALPGFQHGTAGATRGKPKR
jgi:hypothetical protein